MRRAMSVAKAAGFESGQATFDGADAFIKPAKDAEERIQASIRCSSSGRGPRRGSGAGAAARVMRGARR
jgi:hypothetical protein